MSSSAEVLDRAQNTQLTPGRWVLDKNHTTIGFVARHMMVTKVRGRFEEFEGAIHVAENPEDSWAEATIETKSITTHAEQRDDHLRSSDFLAIDEYPQITFRSSKLERSGDGWKATGDLTIKGISRPVELDVTFEGTAVNPYGVEVAFFTAVTEIDREDWDIRWNVALESGGVLVSKKVRLEIEAQAQLER
ncbi:MAG: polyisoprenoid-binding protein [Actinobacteria bacterium]|nr:polyisoprenoid-binding protein [Actinomycetota bacterium]